MAGFEEISLLEKMGEYMSSHGYDRKDYMIYSKDPEWQALNNELLEEIKREEKATINKGSQKNFSFTKNEKNNLKTLEDLLSDAEKDLSE